MKSFRPASADMLLIRTRYVQILLLLCTVCHLTPAFPTKSLPSYDEVRQLQVSMPHLGPVLAPLGSSISLPCLVSLSSVSTSTSSTPVAPRIKWSVVSGGQETQILVVRGHRVKINEAYRDRAAILNYTSSPDDLSLWLGDLHHSDSGHYRCEVQQGLEDASDVIELKVKGVVFHYRDAFSRYAFSFQQAQKACEAIGAQIATPDQLLAAYNDGYEQCDAGWLADQSVRYPIQVPREACYGDMDGQPGVRNYGTMEAENLFDVYCFIEQNDGKVFHDPLPQHLSFDEAQSYCRAAGAKLATTAQLYSEWSEGMDHCSPGWLSDGSVRYPIVNPRERCGGPQAGVKTLYRFSNQTGFPEPSSLHDVYCFKENRKNSSESPVDFITTEAEDIGENVVILMETDQKLQLTQQPEQVEREAQSLLEYLPFFSLHITPKTSAETTTTVISDITESPFSTSAVDQFHPSDETSEMSHFLLPRAGNNTISSTETSSPMQNTSFLPSADNDTDSHHNFSVTFQSRLEISTSEPHTQNQTVPDTNLQETTQPSEELKQLQDIHETSLNISRAQANYSETDSNHTQDAGFTEAATLSIDPMHEVKFGAAVAEDPLQKPISTQTSKEEGTTPTQVAQRLESTTEALTSLWAYMDGSGDFSKEKVLEMDGVTFPSSPPSSTASFMTHSSPSTMANSAPTTHQTEAPDPSLPSGSHHLEKVHLVNSTVPQFWESSISRQEGSTSLETEDTLNLESEEKQLHATQSVDQAVSEAGFPISNSYSPTVTTSPSKTSGYKVYLDTVTSSYEEASGYEPETVSSTFRDAIQVAPTITNETILSPDREKEDNVYFSLAKEIKVTPTLFLEEESKVASTYAEETKVAPTPVFEEEEEEAKIVPTVVIEEEAKVTPTLVVEEAKVTPTFDDEEKAKIVPTLVAEEAKVAPTLVEEEAKVTPALVDEEDKFDQTLYPEEDFNGSTPLVPEGEDTIAPVLDYEEEANGTPFVDVIISTSDSQTLKWALLNTTTRPQMALKDVELSQKISSTAASHSSTKATATAEKTSTTSTTTTTHWSRRTWSPTTTTAKVFHKTAEPQKVTHVIPPVDHGLVDVEISLTQPPTLLILPNERAAVGGTGKSSDACMDDPCLNGGTCTDWNGEIKCLCLPTYRGEFCQTDLERCEPGWDKFQGFCYRHSSQRQSWEVAEQQCRMMGAHLVSIINPEEQDYINSNYKEYQWTGLNDKMIENDFHWSDGNPLLYQNWYRGQPDSYFLSGEDCVVMVWHDNGRWSDVPCNYHLAYTCKKGTSSCGPPPKVRNASMFGKARQRYETNAVVRYHCAAGFLQRLNPLIRCQSGGRWERPQIICIPEANASMQFPDVTSQTDGSFAAAENEFEATEETPLYREIKF